MPLLDEIIQSAFDLGASDLHITPGLPPMVRVHSELGPLERDTLSAQGTRELIGELLTTDQQSRLDAGQEIDFGYELEGVTRLRCNIFGQRKGIAGAFRLIPNEVLTAEQLGLPSQILDFCELPRGLVVVTGATGSGKSTTLAAMLDAVNSERPVHIITIEDPIEFVHQNKRAMINQREVGSNTCAFSSALRAALREDPDIVLVGEMRDLETIQLAITAAETGHLVFGTLHTNSAASTVDRMIDVFPPEQQQQIRIMLAEALKGVIAQRLLPRRDGKGRAAALEVLVGTPALSNLVREGKTHQIDALMQTGRKEGMQTLDHSLKDMVRNEVITAAEAARHANQPEAFNAKSNGRSLQPLR